MEKKSVVQWLKEQYIDRGETLPSGVFQEAKEMEKEQIKRAFESGDKNGFWRYKSVVEEDITSEEYYKRNFG